MSGSLEANFQSERNLTLNPPDKDTPRLFGGDDAAREEVIHRFEDAWAEGKRPEIAACLVDFGADRSELLLELVYIDLEYCIKAGEPARVESYLEWFPELNENEEDLIELLSREFELRCRREQPAVDEYLKRFPKLRDKLSTALRSPDLTQAYSDRVQPGSGDSQKAEEAEPQTARYTWISEVGAGGLGKVWLARDNDLARDVALKEIKPGSASSETVRRLIKEAQITGQLQHPGIVPIYDVNYGGRPFYAMKLVKGETFSNAIREYHERKEAGQEDPISERRLLSIFLGVCDAIAYAHSRGVIHRDLKPENIVLGDFGEAIVLDWGLARQVDSDDDDSAPIMVTESGRTDATLAGQRLGTPAYMAPEQAAGHVERMDQRTDVYGLGAILFEVLTGHPPHRAPGRGSPDLETTIQLQSPVFAMLRQISTGPTPRVRDIDATLPQELDGICAQSMALKRADRFQTAKDLKTALLQFQVHEDSIELTARASGDLAHARQSGAYDDFSRARFGFETALAQWPESTRAAEGLRETCLDFSRTAFDKGDFDLALSLLDEADSSQDPLRTSIAQAAAERDARQQHIRQLRRVSLAASLAVAVVASVAAVWINNERNNAIAAQKITERNAYDSDMVLAQRDWEDANIGHLRKMLDLHRNRYDLKGFEWGYWNHLAHSDLLSLKRHDSLVLSVAFSLDGTRLASASWDQTVKVWDATTGQEELTLRGHTSGIYSVSFSPDGTRLASAGGFDNTVKVWDATTGQETLTFAGHTNTVSSVAFSPDGTRIASASWDQTVKVWDATTGREELTMRGHTSEICSVSFSPDGTRLASAGGFDNTVKVWDATTGRETLTLNGHTGNVLSVSFNADGTQLASGSGFPDESVKVWDARPWTPKLRAESQARGLLTFRRDRVKSLEELRAAIHTDQTISDMVRKQSLTWSEVFWRNYPTQLYLRSLELARQRRLNEATQSAAKLKEIGNTATEGNADMLYNAARAYGLCAAATVQPSEGETETDEAQTRRTSYLDLSLSCLRETIAAGYDNFEHVRKYPDLRALRNLPEFQALFHVPLEEKN
ncbi:MAG: serine/threonine protein kinase [Planctomycetota bacterium]|nr:serine/threonine protein kinase [Planctomycetota bacterium]